MKIISKGFYMSILSVFMFLFNTNIFVNARMYNDYNGFENGLSTAKDLSSISFVGFVFLVIILVIVGIFWISMFIHAIKHRIPNKPIWLLVMWILGIVGAIAYYFSIKKDCPCEPCQKNRNSSNNLVCICDDNGDCVCGGLDKHDTEELRTKFEK